MVVAAELEALCRPVVESMGLEFWGLEYVAHPRNGRLRVYIDSDKGVDIEHCATISRQLGALLDVEDPIPGEYHLEVSSPGLDRPLFKRPHFERYLGHEVRLMLTVPVAGRRRMKGVLVRLEGERLVIGVEGLGECLVPMHQIRQANLVYN